MNTQKHTPVPCNHLYHMHDHAPKRWLRPNAHKMILRDFIGGVAALILMLGGIYLVLLIGYATMTPSEQAKPMTEEQARPYIDAHRGRV